MTAKNKSSTSIPSQPADAAPTPANGGTVINLQPLADDQSTAPISAEELAQFRAKAGQAEENWDKFLRATADLDNYRKRVLREKEELSRATSERVVGALLPVLDNLERALAAASQQPAADNAALLDGLKQIQAQFRRTLEQFGLQEVIAHAGHPFDPNHHEAISQVESVEHPEGTIVDQLQRGYRIADRLLRPARVVVSKGLPTEAKDGAAKQ